MGCRYRARHSHRGIEQGDDLALVYRGKKRVTVLVNERDANGELTGNQVNTEVDRNTYMGGAERLCACSAHLPDSLPGTGRT